MTPVEPVSQPGTKRGLARLRELVTEREAELVLVGLPLSLDGRETEATRTRYVRKRPVPFPPEPFRTAVIQLTRNRLARADDNAGRRGLWLRALDRLGLGFDS